MEMSEAVDLRLLLHRAAEPQRMNMVRLDNHYLGFIRSREDGSTLRPYHTELKFQRSDRERTALLKGEQSLVGLETILDLVLENDDVRIRVDDALYYVFRALGVERNGLGMPRHRECARCGHSRRSFHWCAPEAT